MQRGWEVGGRYGVGSRKLGGVCVPPVMRTMVWSVEGMLMFFVRLRTV